MNWDCKYALDESTFDDQERYVCALFDVPRCDECGIPAGVAQMDLVAAIAVIETQHERIASLETARDSYADNWHSAMQVSSGKDARIEAMRALLEELAGEIEVCSPNWEALDDSYAVRIRALLAAGGVVQDGPADSARSGT